MFMGPRQLYDGEVQTQAHKGLSSSSHTLHSDIPRKRQLSKLRCSEVDLKDNFWVFFYQQYAKGAEERETEIPLVHWLL